MDSKELAKTSDVIAKAAQMAHDNPMALVDVEKARAVQEVQAAFVMARQFPRDTIAVETKVVKECQRYGMASKALFKFPRGGKSVEGPTIRLAEMIATAFGNLHYGWRELSRGRGKSDVEAMCWDLETNVKSYRQFQVDHAMKADGKIKFLTDPRDIYERVANEAARRVRACILERVPGDIIERAVETAKATLRAGAPENRPLIEQVKACVLSFEGYGVKQPHLEKYLGHAMDLTTKAELADLITVHNALKEGEARETYFEIGPKPGECGPAGELRDRLRSGDSTTSVQMPGEELMPWEKK